MGITALPNLIVSYGANNGIQYSTGSGSTIKAEAATLAAEEAAPPTLLTAPTPATPVHSLLPKVDRSTSAGETMIRILAGVDVLVCLKFVPEGLTHSIGTYRSPDNHLSPPPPPPQSSALLPQ